MMFRKDLEIEFLTTMFVEVPATDLNLYIELKRGLQIKLSHPKC
jgi:hypothetical protein